MSEKENTAEDEVRLAPVLGIRPGVYLAVLYAFIILVILFFVFFFPGLSRPGSIAAVRSEPEGAAFYVDGVYMGAAPCKIFVPRGKHEITISLPGFTPFVKEVEFRGRLFASAVFPLIHPVVTTLETEDPGAVFADTAADFAGWTFAGEPTAAYQIPLALSEGAYRAARPGATELRETMNGVMEASARFALTRASLRDLARAKALSDNGGLAPSPVSILRSAEEGLAWLRANPGGRAWLGAVLPEETAGAWLASGTDAKTDDAEAFTAAGRRYVKGTPLIHILPKDRPDGSREEFWIFETAVPSSLFMQFLAENPRRTETAANAADEDAPVTGVSWYAAEAFCSWFTGLLPPEMAGYEARLPSEAEWEAAYSAEFDRNYFQHPDDRKLRVSKGIREWCADPFAPLRLPAPSPAIRAVGSPERPLRGENTDQEGQTGRASLPPDISSPFVSFRPVIAPAGTGG
ncbi:MAG: PEGA domain-containing protein [Treponema sp.]|jgi:hypothetical protein|nr:PEGA domain-containing protein [Treponema sp.]